MEEIASKYLQWKEDNPDEDFQYDEIHNFVAQLSRGDQQDIMEFVLESFHCDCGREKTPRSY